MLLVEPYQSLDGNLLKMLIPCRPLTVGISMKEPFNHNGLLIAKIGIIANISITIRDEKGIEDISFFEIVIHLFLGTRVDSTMKITHDLLHLTLNPCVHA